MAWPDDVTRADLRIEFYRGSGPGGQHRNKRDTACRITHLPTGLSATAEDSRSQADNRTAAFRRLAARLVPLMVPKAERAPLPSERVRTYHEKRGVTDTRAPGRRWGYEDVLRGNALRDVMAATRGSE